MFAYWELPAYHHHSRPSEYRSFYVFVNLVWRRLFAVELGPNGWKLTNHPRPCSCNEAGGVWLRRANFNRWLAFTKKQSARLRLWWQSSKRLQHINPHTLIYKQFIGNLASRVAFNNEECLYIFFKKVPLSIFPCTLAYAFHGMPSNLPFYPQ